MSIFKRAIIMEDGAIIMDSGVNESMFDMLENHNFDAASNDFIRVKLMPANGEWWGHPWSWNFAIEQKSIPEWYEKDRRRYNLELYCALCDWWHAHVRYGEEIERLTSGFYLLKACAVKVLQGNVHVILNNSSVDFMYGKSVVERMSEESEVLEMFDESSVWSKSDDSCVCDVFDCAVVYLMGNKYPMDGFMSYGMMIEFAGSDEEIPFSEALKLDTEAVNSDVINFESKKKALAENSKLTANEDEGKLEMMDNSFVITGWRISKFLMNFDGISDGKHTFSFGMRLEILSQPDDEENIVNVEISYAEKDKEPVLAAKLCGDVQLPWGLSFEEKEEILTYEAAPILYEELRWFVEEAMEKSNIGFVDYIPYAEDIEMWNDFYQEVI